MNVRAIGIAGVLALALPATAAHASSVATTVSAATTSTRHATTRRRVTVTPADRAATRAYLVAVERADEAQLANTPQSIAAAQALAGRISSECTGALDGAPTGKREPIKPEAAPNEPGAARAEGERQRQSAQLFLLKTELSFALDNATSQPNREATQALLGALAPLKWSNPLVTLSLHLMVGVAQEELSLTAPPVCADLRSWAQSDYKTLSPASKEFRKQTETLFKHSLESIGLYLSGHVKPFPEILVPYEGTADKRLARHTEALATQRHGVDAARVNIRKRLEATVGLPIEKVEPVKHEIRKPAVVVRGKTAGGGHFVVRAERIKRGQSFRGQRCTTEITIEEPSRPTDGGLFNLDSEGGSGRCLARSHVEAEPSVSCDSGLLAIEAGLLPATRNVRLLLSNGRTVTSRAIHIPPRLGGPAGYYYQAVRGPSPIPVSLTELDANGSALTVLKLKAVVECTKKRRKYFHGGIVRLVHESLPQAPPFTIRAERYRELGSVHFELKLEEDIEEEGLFMVGSDGGGGILLAEGAAPLSRPLQVFEAHESSGCNPQPYTIVYGLLKAPRDTVLMRTPSGLVPLRTVPIPARLRAGGVLAYGVFSPIPTELVIQDVHGNTIGHDDLRAMATNKTETCEGEAEG